MLIGGEQASGAPGEPVVEDSKQVRAWALYAWANHGWSTPVGAVLIGPWMLALAVHAAGKDGTLIALGPLALRASAYPSLMIALAALMKLVVLPTVGTASDARALASRLGPSPAKRAPKRLLLAGACATGSVICAVLALTGGGEWLIVGLLFLAGSIAEGVSDLSWNGMLPELAPAGRRDAVSSGANAFGYLGAGLILAADLALISAHAELGLTRTAAVRLCFLTAALWWAGFGLAALRRLHPEPRLRASSGTVGGATRGSAVPGQVAPGQVAPGQVAPGQGGPRGAHRAPGGSFENSARQGGIAVQLRLLRSMPQTFRFILAYLCFADAMSAVVALASTFLTHQLFADNTAKASPFLFGLILLIQFVAMGGSLLFGRLAKRFGAKRSVLAGIAVWCVVIIFAYAVLKTQAEAVAMGVAIGVVLGGTSALARSLFAQMVPAGREAAFFSFYEVSSQGTAWVAPLLFTVVVDATGSFRQAILSLIALFIVGFVLLARTDTRAAALEATEAASR